MTRRDGLAFQPKHRTPNRPQLVPSSSRHLPSPASLLPEDVQKELQALLALQVLAHTHMHPTPLPFRHTKNIFFSPTALLPEEV